MHLGNGIRLRLLLLVARYQNLSHKELSQALNISSLRLTIHLNKLLKDGVIEEFQLNSGQIFRLHSTLPLWAKTTLLAGSRNHQTFIEEDFQRLNRITRNTLCY